MKYLALLLFIIPSAYANTSSDSADSSESDQSQAKAYCLSMVQDGTPDAEMHEFVNQCMAEQIEYLDETSSGIKPDCYQQVDDIIQQKLDSDPNSSYDYDLLLDNCFNETNLD